MLRSPQMGCGEKCTVCRFTYLYLQVTPDQPGHILITNAFVVTPSLPSYLFWQDVSILRRKRDVNSFWGNLNIPLSSWKSRLTLPRITFLFHHYSNIDPLTADKALIQRRRLSDRSIASSGCQYFSVNSLINVA